MSEDWCLFYPLETWKSPSKGSRGEIQARSGTYLRKVLLKGRRAKSTRPESKWGRKDTEVNQERRIFGLQLEFGQTTGEEIKRRSKIRRAGASICTLFNEAFNNLEIRQAQENISGSWVQLGSRAKGQGSGSLAGEGEESPHRKVLLWARRPRKSYWEGN